VDRGHAACGRTDAISDPRLHPEYFPTLGCSGQSSLPEDSVEVELDLMAQKGSMDGNVSRPANQGVQPRRFYRSRNGWLRREAAGDPGAAKRQVLPQMHHSRARRRTARPGGELPFPISLAGDPHARQAVIYRFGWEQR